MTGRGCASVLKDTLVERHHVGVVVEEQIQVLQRLGQEEALHLVVLGGRRAQHGLEVGVPSSAYPGVGLERIEDLPPPLACVTHHI